MTIKFFNDLHLKFSRKEYLNSDPIEFCYLFQNKLDIELVGFLSAMFSYGNVKSIKTYLSNLIQLLTPSPSEFLLKKDLQTIRNKLHYYQPLPDYPHLGNSQWINALDALKCGMNWAVNMLLRRLFAAGKAWFSNTMACAKC